MKSYCKSCNPMKNIHKMSHLKCIYFINLRYFSFDRSSRPEVFCKKISACNFIKKEILAQVFCCEFCEMIKNTFLCRTPLVAASVIDTELQDCKTCLGILIQCASSFYYTIICPDFIY